MSKWLVLIIILAAILRFIYLNEVPPGPSYDEIQVILNSQSLAKTGKSIPGTVTGIFGQAKGNIETGVFSELGSYILALWTLVFGLNWTFIKIPFILTSLGMVIFIYLITKKITNQNCALIAALLFSINPWSIYIGRTAYESLFSYLAYLAVIYFFIRLPGWKILYILPILIIGFLTYFGAKPQFPLLIILGLFLNYLYIPKVGKKNIKPLLVLTVGGVIFLAMYVLIFINNPASLRLGETKNQTYQQIVDLKRRISIPSSLTYFTENKFMEQFKERILAYFGVLSPSFLFLEGSTWGPEFLIISDHGPMYLIDFFLIVIGLIALSRLYPKSLILILGSILVALVPNAVSLSAKNYVIRDGLLYPLFTILSGVGIWFITTFRKVKPYKYYLLAIIGILYIFSFLIFINRYFFRTPVDKNEGWNFQSRVLAHYLLLNSRKYPNQKSIVVTNDLNGVSYIYLLFTNHYQTRDEILNINSILANKSYDFNGVKFLNKCPDKLEDINLILDQRINCFQNIKYLSQIASPKDGGGKYLIYNDKLCTGNKNHYPLLQSINDLNIEKLSEQEFCQKWITSP